MNTTDTFVIYKSSLHNEIYKWNKCSNNSECINTIGSFNCTCLPGYDGDGFDCIDINECKLNEINQFNTSCTLNSECINLPGGYECKCLNGFELKNNKCIGIHFMFVKIYFK
jgi:hypothetical protein